MKASEVLREAQRLIDSGEETSLTGAVVIAASGSKEHEAFNYLLPALDRAFPTRWEAIAALDRAIALAKDDEDIPHWRDRAIALAEEEEE